MSKKHYCMDCIHCREALDVKISSAPSYWCKLEDDLVENYGDKRLSKYKKKVLCSEKNADGTCTDFDCDARKLLEPPPPPVVGKDSEAPDTKAVPDPDVEPPAFEAVDEGWDSGKEGAVMSKPVFPCGALIYETDIRQKCPKCGSSFKRKWIWLGRVLGCIQPRCENYYGGKAHKLHPKDTRLTEGMVRKGGKGSRPEGSPPPPPKGQRP